MLATVMAASPGLAWAPPPRMVSAGRSSRRREFGRMRAQNVAFSAEEEGAKSVKVLMAAGGTGGHVYPALAIADEIRRLTGGGAAVEFAGARDRLEWAAVPGAGYAISAVPAVAVARPVLGRWENLLLPGRLAVALVACWRLLRRVRPDVVVGTGGYVSGPLCLAAAAMGCPVVIQEQNARAGWTNRILGTVAAAVVFVAFSAAVPYFPERKCALYGNPVRSELRRDVPAVAVARNFFFPWAAVPGEIAASGPLQEGDDGTQVLLILGGSLGAMAVNRAVAGIAVSMLEAHPSRRIIWQTGPAHYAEIVAQVDRHPRLAIFPYLEAMHLAYAASSLVVARAGAITCSELLVTGKPSILIPSPNVAEDHQTKNAMSMQEQGSAILLPESSLTSRALADMVNELLGDVPKLNAMSTKAQRAATPDASTRIAKHVISLIK